MKRISLNLLFLIIVGLVIGWKEWTNSIVKSPNKESIETTTKERRILFNRVYLSKELTKK